MSREGDSGVAGLVGAPVAGSIPSASGAPAVAEAFEFTNAAELLGICAHNAITLSEAMRRREQELSGESRETLDARMSARLNVMRSSVEAALREPRPSLGGLIGGEARRTLAAAALIPNAGSDLMGRMVAYSMAVLETSATMGVIVAAPTAGSSGVVPGVLLALEDCCGCARERIVDGLFAASAIGYLLTRNASVSGAEAGCQAEVGSAAAMAAAAMVEVLGGEPELCVSAASMALANLMGLACDPVCGLVEIPCQGRNAMGALNAAACARVALGGSRFPIPFDETAAAMLSVGRSMPAELRETALGGCARTPFARSCAACGACGR